MRSCGIPNCFPFNIIPDLLEINSLKRQTAALTSQSLEKVTRKRTPAVGEDHELLVRRCLGLSSSPTDGIHK